MRFATISGLWYGSEITPVPKRIDRVRSAATAINNSGRADRLPTGGMVFTNPGFVKTEPVEPLHQLKVAVHARGRVLIHRMEGRQEDTVTKLNLGHGWLAKIGTIVCANRRSRKHPSVTIT